MIEAILLMLGIGGTCGLILAVASKVFYVYEDPRIAQIEGTLAGANCGGCGFAGCAAAAEAVVLGNATPSVCIVAGPDTAEQVGAIMGMESSSAEPLKSYNNCEGGLRADDRYFYNGISGCAAASALYGGRRECKIGCLGYGDCVKSCLFDAIEIGDEGYPVVDQEKCVGCGACHKVCPKNIIEIKTISQRLLHLNLEDDALAPCRQKCPAQIDIPRYISQIRSGDYEGAVNTIRERNPLLLSCGRVCPHPCEDDCRRGIEDDEAVSINQLKRFVADYELNTGTRFPVKCAPPTGYKVAVIGGGPAGLSCAFFLKRVGHDVTIFDSMPQLGGMIRYGIPEYRLPKEVLKWEIDGILNLGIKAVPNVRLGYDITIESLKSAGYDAIFLGIGAWKDYGLGIEGDDLNGCYTGIDFLTKFAENQQGDSDLTVPIGTKCAVIGGGNTAIDCVRTLVRLGVKDVYIIYRRTRKEMPANMVEIEAAEHEGIKFVFLAAPNKVIDDGDGNVKGLEYLQMELGEPDASGRRRPVPIEGSETIIDLDMLITAIGQGPNIDFVEKGKGKRIGEIATTRWSTIDSKNPEMLQSSIPYIFSGGDAATGASLVVEAIGGGRRAARSIDAFLKGQKVESPKNSLFEKKIPESIFEKVPGVGKTKRTPLPELPVDERIKSFIEADLVITEEDAIYESNRCLNCCRVCYNKDQALLT